MPATTITTAAATTTTTTIAATPSPTLPTLHSSLFLTVRPKWTGETKTKPIVTTSPKTPAAPMGEFKARIWATLSRKKSTITSTADVRENTSDEKTQARPRTGSGKRPRSASVARSGLTTTTASTQGTGYAQSTTDSVEGGGSKRSRRSRLWNIDDSEVGHEDNAGVHNESNSTSIKKKAKTAATMTRTTTTTIFDAGRKLRRRSRRTATSSTGPPSHSNSSNDLPSTTSDPASLAEPTILPTHDTDLTTAAPGVNTPTTNTTTTTTTTTPSPIDGLNNDNDGDNPHNHDAPAHEVTTTTLGETSPSSPHPASTAARLSYVTSDSSEDDTSINSPAIASPVAIHVTSHLSPPPRDSRKASSSSSSPLRPQPPLRQQSILPPRQRTLIKALLDSHDDDDASYIGEPITTTTSRSQTPLEVTPASAPLSGRTSKLTPISGTMVTRKVWVKRPLASPTLITINEDDLVDDVRDMILRKYANSLGRQFDSPDLIIRICNRDQHQASRALQPDEPIARTLDAHFPGGQAIDEALLIDIPSRRTPKASPIPRINYSEDGRPHESGTDYFPPYPPQGATATVVSHLGHAAPQGAIASVNGHAAHFPNSMTIIGGNQLPPLPSPGTARRLHAARPKMQRMHTASPASTNSQHASQTGAPPMGIHSSHYIRPARSRTHSGTSSEHSNQPAAAPAAAVPSPPAPERVATPPPPRTSSPRPQNRLKKTKKIETPTLPPGILNGGVPPINVLIVEDNIINLKLLEAFVKRLKVRWQTAMNGRDAVNKWRDGGFHLVLMDIQLPVMNGLDATREIRRIEKVNSIGVFSSSASSAPEEVQPQPAEEDRLANTEMFKSPVIIVALTASSLQSDRHEALAAGCNDFLTKPVNFVWLERKVKEWGCMQALIDFDGWRKWKDFSQQKAEDEAKKQPKPSKKTRPSVSAAA